MSRSAFVALMVGLPLVAALAVAEIKVDVAELGDTEGMEIEGNVTNVLGNKFVMEDSTGSIIVDTGPNWNHSLDLETGVAVSVVGEIGRDGEFDAFRIAYADGRVQKFREPGGPAPWAGPPPWVEPEGLSKRRGDNGPPHWGDDRKERTR